MQQKVKTLIETQWFQITIITLIIANAIILGMETDAGIMARFGGIIAITDGIILKVFVIEILLRIYAYRLELFKKPWVLFDIAVVAIALIPASEAFSALRALRVLRILRLISVVPAMRRVIEGLLTAIPGIASVSSIMLLFFYVFSVIGTHLYGAAFPEWFGSLDVTMFTLFQIMTLESWSMGIVRPIMEQFPFAWLFFISYILVTTFTMLNLFIAIIVNAMHTGTDESAEKSRLEMRDTLRQDMQQMEQRLLKELSQLKK